MARARNGASPAGDEPADPSPAPVPSPPLIQLTPEDAQATPSVEARIADLSGASPAAEDAIAAKMELIARLDLPGVFGAETGGTGAANIVAVGLGRKTTANRATPFPAVKVFVDRKLPASQVDRDALIPDEINGIPTDVEQLGVMMAYSGHLGGQPRPVKCGSGIGADHSIVTWGTLGCLVVAKNTLCILSNNHILAALNQGQRGYTKILQPGRGKGGHAPDDVIGVLEDFVPLDFTGKTNLVDAALARTSYARNYQLVDARHFIFRISTTLAVAKCGMWVAKCGATTDFRTGRVSCTNLYHREILYPAVGQKAVFDHLMLIRSEDPNHVFSDSGDSGSLIVTRDELQPTALLLAGGGQDTLAVPIQAVKTALGITDFVARVP